MHKSTFLFSVNNTTLDALGSVNLDSVFVSQQDLVKKITEIKKIKGESLKINVSVSVFASDDLLKKYPDARPVESSGKNTKNGLCPTHKGVRRDVLEQIKNACTHDINGIWLDNLTYPTQWDVTDPEVLDTCYCTRCLKLFEKYIGEPIEGVGGEGSDLENKALYIDGSYYHEWLEFKTNQITSFVEQVRKIVSDENKNISLGIFVVPWKDKEYGAGIKRVLGQDFDKLSELVDVFSPMLYHKMLGYGVSFVNEMVDYYWQLGKTFLPLIQTEDKPQKLSATEFDSALTFATKKPSFGVCAFYFDDLIKSSEKFDVLKEFFS